MLDAVVLHSNSTLAILAAAVGALVISILSVIGLLLHMAANRIIAEVTESHRAINARLDQHEDSINRVQRVLTAGHMLP